VKFPCIFPVNREFGRREGFAPDCVHRQQVLDIAGNSCEIRTAGTVRGSLRAFARRRIPLQTGDRFGWALSGLSRRFISKDELDGSVSRNLKSSGEAQQGLLLGPGQGEIGAFRQRLGSHIDGLGAGKDRRDDIGGEERQR